MASDTRLTTMPDGFCLPTEPRAARVRHLSTRMEPRRYRSLAEWQQRRGRIRRHVLVSCGLWPTPEKTPLNARVFGKLDRDGYTIEKVHFQAVPGFFVTGNLYRPARGGKRRPAVLCPHGHWPEGRLHDDDVGSVPARCITLARQGYVVFAYDMIGYNDADQIPHPRHKPTGNKFTLTGRREQLWSISAMGLQLWNGIRAIDFLESLPDVDARRIGCTGASGGGTQTFMLMAADDRLAAAAPVNMVSAHFQGGCECENAPNLRIDTHNVEIAATFAPKPLLLVAASGDWTHETAEVEYPAIRAVYRLFGAEDNVACIRINGPHNYNRQSREAVYAWFGLSLLGRKDTEGLQERPFQAESPVNLRVFGAGKRPRSALDADALVEALVKTRRRQLQRFRPGRGSSSNRLAETFGVALAHSLGLGCRTPGKVVADEVGRVDFDGIDAGKLLLSRPGGIHKVPALLFGKNRRGAVGPTVLVIHPRGKAGLVAGSAGRPTRLLRALIDAGCRVMAVDCFNTGELLARPSPRRRYASVQYFTTYNCTDVARAVQDIVLSLDHLRPGRVVLLGLGRAGPWAMLAAPFARRLDRAVIDLDQFDGADEQAWAERLFVPGLLRAGGLDTAGAMFAPRPLLVHNASRFDPERIVRAYEAAGRPDAFRCEPGRMTVAALADWVTGR